MNRKTLRISAELFESFLKEPSQPAITQQGMPEDARIVAARFDAANRSVVLTIESAEFTNGGDMVVSFTRAY